MFLIYSTIFSLVVYFSTRYASRVRYYLRSVRAGVFLYSYVEILSLSLFSRGLYSKCSDDCTLASGYLGMMSSSTMVTSSINITIPAIISVLLFCSGTTKHSSTNPTKHRMEIIRVIIFLYIYQISFLTFLITHYQNTKYP